MRSILKQLKDQPAHKPTGDAVCGDVPAMARYIAERTGMTPDEVVRRLDGGETIETCFSTYRKYE